MNYGKQAAVAATLVFASSQAFAQTPVNYQEPTRGFLLERGQVAAPKSFSVDLSTGVDGGSNTGGVRIGIPHSELIINSDLNGDEDANEIALKWGLPELRLGDAARLDWAVYGGIAHIDIEDNAGNDTDYTNLVAGTAFTMEQAGLILNLNPEVEFADDERDDTIFNLGFGAYYNLFDTEYGRFQPGAEVTVVSGGDDDEDDTVVDVGMRWMVRENITMDFVVFHRGPTDATSIPGIIRLNAAF